MSMQDESHVDNRMAQMEIEAGYVESSIDVKWQATRYLLSEVPRSPWTVVTDMDVVDWAIVANRLFEPGERGHTRKAVEKHIGAMHACRSRWKKDPGRKRFSGQGGLPSLTPSWR